MVNTAKKSRSILRAPYDLDRRDGRGMEAAHFKSFYHFEPEIRSGRQLEPNEQFEHDLKSRVITHNDSPDFRVRVNDIIIGVEIRRLFISPDGPALESTQESIFDQVCRKAEHLNLPPVDVTLFFNLRKPLRGADCRRIADAVVQVVATNLPADGDIVELENRPGQPAEVDLIQINRARRESRPEQGRWRADFNFSAIVTDVFGIVQTAIKEKAARLPTYLKVCDECWLLLVADSFKASGNLKFSGSEEKHPLLSPFKRTYALDFGRGCLHRLC
jgi:hypothetical protein